MTYTTIATVLHDAAADRAAVETAAAFAETANGHLDAICLGIDRVELGTHFAGANAIAVQEAFQIAREEAETTFRAVEALLDGRPFGWDAQGYAIQIGAVGQTVASKAQFADLIVIPKPYGDGRGAVDVAIAEAALFGTRSPVLVVPPDHDHGLKVDTVVLAWNDSPEALSAIRGAMPIIEKAAAVNIVIIDPPSHGAHRSDPGGALAEALSRKGVRPDISVLARTMPKISDVLLRHLSDVSGDLLVMGAYGHSRFREAIFGGATRDLLEASEIPVLMAH
ncbi:MAG: universal stress protein [Paracoccaceae bacterium]|nr:universal stress protein [Paracoccaceae bacterium]